ncbi:type II secretion system F family protein [Chloroflexota bacterium]
MKYIYYAYTDDKRVKSGTIDAISPNAAEEALLKAGFQRVLNLRDTKSKHALKRGITPSLFSNKSKNVLEFSRELANLLQGGISIINALELLKQQIGNTAFKAITENIASELRAGSSLSQAISQHPKVFSTTYVAIIKASEQSGNIHTGLQHMVDHLEKQLDINDRTKRALTYPALVTIMAIGVVALMVTAVLPPMIGLFESLGTDLPPTTRFLVAFTSFIVDNKNYVLAALIISPILFAGYISVPSNRDNIDRLLLKIPLIGQVILKTNLFFYCRTSALLLEAGIQISNMLPICNSTISNKKIRDTLTKGERQLLLGQPFSRAMQATGLFPASSIAALVVGEKTGELDSALKHIAGYFERTSNEMVTNLVSMLEPALTITIGLGVGFLAISIISPIYSLSGGLP